MDTLASDTFSRVFGPKARSVQLISDALGGSAVEKTEIDTF